MLSHGVISKLLRRLLNIQKKKIALLNPTHHPPYTHTYMGKKMKLIASLLKTLEPRSSSSSWSWPSCHHPKTLSFRASSDFFKTINSAYLDLPDNDAPDPIETMIRGGLRSSDRLFFEPDQTSSILESKLAATSTLAYKDTLVLSMESKDPFVDFRKSMEEMVEAHGVKDWDSLEELLCWYLRVNAKSNHGYIMGAFVDLLLALSLSSESSSLSSASSHSPSSLSSYTSSPSSSSTTPCASCVEADEDVQVVKREIKRSEDEASSSSTV